MKKSLLLGAICALFMAQAAVAQNADGVTYVEDPSQGYLFNKFHDNWFITAEGGATLELNADDGRRPFQDRFAPAASLYVGKWFSPLIGLRLGLNWMQVKSLTEDPGYGRPDEPTYDGFYKNKWSELGPVGDIMLDITNWWGGYRPGRRYDLMAYAGAGVYFSFYKAHDANGITQDWRYAHERVLTVRVGLINSIKITPQFALSLDLRYSAHDSHNRFIGGSINQTAHVVQAYLGATYLFNKRDWSHPVVPVCPPAEDCSGVLQQLADANARIAELEHQLDSCLKRPATQTIVEKVENDAPLATIYFPIAVSKLTQQDSNVLTAVAEVMKQNPSRKYVVTGWADNYTGTDQINNRLRNERAYNAAEFLMSLGVPADQLNVTINSGNLSDLGEKFVALDRAVTIELAH